MFYESEKFKDYRGDLSRKYLLAFHKLHRTGKGTLIQWHHGNPGVCLQQLPFSPGSLYSDTVSAIGAYAFNGCTNLSTIHLPPNLKHIPEGMFNGCKSLKKVFLADTIETIGDYAFAGCTSLRKPWIPKNIQHISETAFSVSEK